MTIEQLQQQLEELQKQLATLTGGYVPPEFSIRHYVADEGKVFQRYDGMMMGKELYLGYDYSLGFKRMDYIEFYEQVDDPNTMEDEEEYYRQEVAPETE